MNKKLFYVIPFASAGLLALIGNNATSVNASMIDVKIPNTTSKMEHYFINGEVKTLDSVDIIERNADLTIKTKTSSHTDFLSQELGLYSKREYTYDNKGNLIQEDYYLIDQGNWVINGKDTYQYNEDNNLVLQKEFIKGTDGLKQKKEFEYTYNGKLLNTYKEYFFDSENTKNTQYIDNYEYNANSELIKETRYIYTNSVVTGGCIYEFEYNEDGTLKNKKLDSFNDSSLTNRTSSYLYSYEYSGDTVTEIKKEYNGSAYVNSSKEITTDNDFVYDVKTYGANGDSWNFSSGIKYSYNFTNGRLITATLSTYSGESNLVAYEEVVYDHIEIASNNNAKKGSAAGAVIGVIFGVLVLAFCGLFYFWKKELEKAIKDGAKEDRKLKMFDVVYRPINRLIFGKDKDPFEAK